MDLETNENPVGPKQMVLNQYKSRLVQNQFQLVQNGMIINRKMVNTIQFGLISQESEVHSPACINR